MSQGKGSKQGSEVAEDSQVRVRGVLGLTCFPLPRTLTQEDPGDNQITLEEITQMVSRMTIAPDHQGDVLPSLITP